MKMDYCKNYLLKIWGFGFLGVLILLVFQTFSGKYGERYAEVSGWLIPLLMPTLSLIVGVFIADKQNKDLKNQTANINIFNFAKTGSIIYILIIFAVFLLEPFFSYSPFQMLTIAKPFLTGIDGILTALIGYFFLKK